MATEREFDANEALVRALSEGITNNAGTVAAVLDYLDDLGYLTKRQESGRPGSGWAPIRPRS
jgi:hypothetical protein